MRKAAMILFGVFFALPAFIFLCAFVYFLFNPAEPTIQEWCHDAGGISEDTYCFLPVDKD